MRMFIDLLDWIYGQTQITKKKGKKREDEINSNLVLLDVIHQQQPGHDLLLKSVIQLG